MTQLVGIDTTFDDSTLEWIEWDVGTGTIVAVTWTGARLPLAELPDELVSSTIDRIAKELADPEVSVLDVQRIVAELHRETDYFFWPEAVSSS